MRKCRLVLYPLNGTRLRSVKHEDAASFQLTDNFPPQQSFLNWSAVTIHSPAITSHTVDPQLLPANHIQGKKYITCYDPSNGLHITTLPADAEMDINIKIDAAKNAFESWKTSSFAARKRVIRSLLAWILREREMLARVCCRDTGKTSQ